MLHFDDAHRQFSVEGSDSFDAYILSLQWEQIDFGLGGLHIALDFSGFWVSQDVLFRHARQHTDVQNPLDIVASGLGLVCFIRGLPFPARFPENILFQFVSLPYLHEQLHFVLDVDDQRIVNRAKTTFSGHVDFFSTREDGFEIPVLERFFRLGHQFLFQFPDFPEGFHFLADGQSRGGGGLGRYGCVRRRRLSCFSFRERSSRFYVSTRYVEPYFAGRLDDIPLQFSVLVRYRPDNPDGVAFVQLPLRGQEILVAKPPGGADLHPVACDGSDLTGGIGFDVLRADNAVAPRGRLDGQPFVGNLLHNSYLCRFADLRNGVGVLARARPDVDIGPGQDTLVLIFVALLGADIVPSCYQHRCHCQYSDSFCLHGCSPY